MHRFVISCVGLLLVLGPPGPSAAELPVGVGDEPEPVFFPSDGAILKGWIAKPEGEGPFPAIVYNHGSEKHAGSFPNLARFYAKKGYVFFAPVRRGHDGSPGDYIVDLLRAFRASGESPRRIGENEIRLHELYNRDVVAGLEWLRRQPFVDGDRIAVSGVSYGGIQTLLTAEKGAGIKAAVPFAPAAMSWRSVIILRERLERAVEKATVPLFLIQAEGDYNLGPSEVLGPLIRKKGPPNEARIYPRFGNSQQEAHGAFATQRDGIAVWGRDVLRFLDAAGMKGQKPAATLPKAARGQGGR